MAIAFNAAMIQPDRSDTPTATSSTRNQQGTSKLMIYFVKSSGYSIRHLYRSSSVV